LPDRDNFNAVWRHSIERGEFGRLRDLLAIIDQDDVAVHLKLQMVEPVQRMLETRLRSGEAGAEDPEVPLFLARLLLRKATCNWQVGKLAQAIADTEAGQRHLDGLPRTPVWTEVGFRLRMRQAYLLQDRGDYEAAIQLRRALLAELPQIHTQLWPYQPDRTLLYWQAEITAGLFYPLYRLGRYEEAENVTRQALQWFVALPWACNANALANLGSLHHLRGEYGEALRLGIESLQANEAHRQQAFGLTSLLTMAQAETALGRLADARAHYLRVHAVSRALGRPATLARSMAGLAELELALGRSVKARETYAAMLAFCEQNALEWGELEAIARIGLGRAALALGDPAAADAAFSQALRCRGRFAVTTMDALAGLAQVSALAGDRGHAVELTVLVAGHRVTSHQVRQLMSRSLAGLEAELPAEQFAAATARGRARALTR
jgi:tetratricopeptide (TPR) repeat protein